MAKYLEARQPLTEQEIWDCLTKHVEQEERHWGKDDFYAEWARETRERKMADWKNGKVIEVESVDYVSAYGNGTGNYSDVLMSDGTVKTICYGYYD